jgi:hypothetical protein
MFTNLFKTSCFTTPDVINTSIDDQLNVKDSWLDLWKCLWDSTID